MGGGRFNSRALNARRWRAVGLAAVLGGVSVLTLLRAEMGLPRAREARGAPDWVVEYDGYGAVSFDEERRAVSLNPRVTAAEEMTHAALALSRFTNETPVRDFTVSFEFTLASQHRQPRPNPWESLWLFFSYRRGEDLHSKETNYVAFKTNGIEVGRAYGELGQDFLYTRESPAVQVGQSVVVTVRRGEGRLRIWMDGALALDESEEGLGLYPHAGAVGIYSEDARIEVRRFRLGDPAEWLRGIPWLGFDDIAAE